MESMGVDMDMDMDVEMQMQVDGRWKIGESCSASNGGRQENTRACCARNEVDEVYSKTGI